MHSLTVYLDSGGNVLATAAELGQSTPSLGVVQITFPSADERIEGAPEGLRDVGKAGLQGVYPPSYHRKVSGDGTSLDDYDEVEDLENLKQHHSLLVGEQSRGRIPAALLDSDAAVVTLRSKHSTVISAIDAAASEGAIVAASASWLSGGDP